MSLGAPQPIGPQHVLDEFDSGVEVLGAWLRRRALANERAGASRTFVVAEGNIVRAYYSLSAGCVSKRDVVGRIRRNIPDPIPAMLLGRMAVDLRLQGEGLARALVQDAVLRALAVAEIVGVRCLMVHALSPAAAGFWAHLGFTASPQDPLLLAIKLSDLAALSSSPNFEG